MAKGPYTRVAVLKGGSSAEREVSLRSGQAVAEGLRQAGYVVEELDIVDCAFVLPAGIEAVFPALHGGFGEDGRVQAVLEELGVPYVGAGPAASAWAMDKLYTKRLLAEAGVPTPAFEMLRGGERCSLPLPVVVKPPAEGSSVGVAFAESPSQLAAAMAAAFEHGDEILVEAFIPGRELTVGILDERVLPVVEICAPGGWYGFGEKYLSSQTTYVVPAVLSAEQLAACESAARRTYDLLSCSSMGRVDIRLAEDDTPYVLELNTLPGFTSSSLLPKAAAAAGLDFSALCDHLMQSAALKGSPISG
jgi:D-alanine-D-alanine ligase